jgi:hypothetical protein
MGIHSHIGRLILSYSRLSQSLSTGTIGHMKSRISIKSVVLVSVALFITLLSTVDPSVTWTREDGRYATQSSRGRRSVRVVLNLVGTNSLCAAPLNYSQVLVETGKVPYAFHPLAASAVGGYVSSTDRPLETSVTDPYLATVEWRNLSCDGRRVHVCPASSPIAPNDTCATSWIYVRITDNYGMPVPNLPVNATFEGACAIVLCSPAFDRTDTNGEASLVIRAGLDMQNDTSCCVVKTAVTCSGTVVHRDTLKWMSPDMDADSIVSQFDKQILNLDWHTSASRSDFNCDGVVDADDYDTLQVHLKHNCCYVVPTGVGDQLAHGSLSELSQNSPNPFNPLTDIRFYVAVGGKVALRVYDVAGRPVNTLVDGWREAGSYTVTWNARDDNNNPVASGIYFYRLEAPGFSQVRKMVILK